MYKDKERCVNYYQNEAAVYDQRRFSCVCRRFYDKLFKESIYRYLNDTNFVLEVGTGTGRFAIYLAQKGKKVVALDYSWEMLSQACEKSIIDGVYDKIYFVQGDIENLPFKKNTFDGIFGIHVIVHFKFIRKIIAEFSRSLKTNGVIVFEHAGFLSRITSILRTRIFNKQFSYPDYYHSYSYIRGELANKKIKIQDSRKIKKFPRFLLHVLVCKFSFESLIQVFEKVEKINFGMVRIIRGVNNK